MGIMGRVLERRAGGPQGCIKLANHNVAADVSRLKLSNFAQLFLVRDS